MSNSWIVSVKICRNMVFDVECHDDSWHSQIFTDCDTTGFTDRWTSFSFKNNRPATSQAVGATGHVRSIWHRRSRHSASKTVVFLRSVWWHSVLAVVLPRWPYPADPSTRFHLFGRACQVRRTAGKHSRGHLLFLLFIQQTFPWSLPTLALLYIATLMTVKSIDVANVRNVLYIVWKERVLLRSFQCYC